MKKKDSHSLFNTIAPVYGLFYRYQKERFLKVMRGVRHELDVTAYETVLDVGCGTGALCSVLKASGLRVTGIDPAEKMLGVARSQPENRSIPFIRADVLKRLPFEDKSFDISIASYVAHGLQKKDRDQMYSEMRRVTRSKVIIYDYNQKRGLLTSVIEWLEHGAYFRFIKNAKNEMENCVTEMQACFSDVKAVDVDARAAWYICTTQ
jgi:ubiquinone/menaquinone biosynthesis C-methylase UbiE